jgi:hydroxylamine oxidation protein HaoB
VTGGLLLLGWFAYLWFKPIPAPYQYQLTAEGDSKQFPQMDLDDWPDLALSQYKVQAEGIDKPIAELITARRNEEPPVLIYWKNSTNEVLYNLDRKPSELSALATVIGRHAPKDALILSWWDTARQIKLLTGHDTLFTSHLNEPLMIPVPWLEQSEAIQAYENQFWKSKADRQEQEQFKRFSQALAAPAQEGIKQLRELIGTDREAYLIVHVTDLYKLGLMHPDKIGVAYQNFPMTGNMHGMINHMKVQLKENDFDTYTLQSISDEEIRVFFLSDAESSQTLLARLLPFVDKKAPTEQETAQLIYQQGGYWVYKLP